MKITWKRCVSATLAVWVLAIVSVAYPQEPATPAPDPGSAPLVDAFNSDAAKALGAAGIREVVFIKRTTLDANHFYTEYWNSSWTPGGNVCVLDLETGAVRELAPSLTGVFNRFDVSFDAKKVVFDFKPDKNSGYRIYEVNVDGTGLRQLSFPPEEEAGFAKKYGGVKAHGRTDDMHPCYLPDGGIVFVSTRCQYGILCNTPDMYTTKVLYRMDGDGSNVRKLSNSVVSEACPTMLPDGRVLYHRWEYNDKTQVVAKCLWAMRPDGTESSEVYGNTLGRINTLIYGRAIPGSRKIVALGTTHCCPNNALGTVVTIDTDKSIRTIEPLDYITEDIGATTHNGFDFLVNGEWLVAERTGRPGRLFKDPYPINEDLFLVSQKPKGYEWSHPAAYDIYLLNGDGESVPLYQTKEISCWHPYPLVARETPPALGSPVNEQMAKAGKAHCVVTDVYVGLDGVERGAIKFLRVLEQIPRPWAAHTPWSGDAAYGSHTVVGMNTLGVKVQHGVVPVEEDGSAFFEVPAERNIYFQALDENYMMVQTERTYVNYMPGETRSCLGCHETPDVVPAPAARTATPMALRRGPSVPQAQPGEESGRKVIDYLRQVQPVFDKHCVSCHSGQKPKAKLDLSPTPTTLFTASYRALMDSPFTEGVTRVGEKWSASEIYKGPNNLFREPYHSGSHTAPITVALSGGDILPRLSDDDGSRLKRLAKAHGDVELTEAEFVTVINWVDTFGQFYPSYWGLKNAGFAGHEFFRPETSFDEAISLTIPERLRDLYDNPPPSDHLNPKKNRADAKQPRKTKQGDRSK